MTQNKRVLLGVLRPTQKHATHAKRARALSSRPREIATHAPRVLLPVSRGEKHAGRIAVGCCFPLPRAGTANTRNTAVEL
jgi:hypothetical protein